MSNEPDSIVLRYLRDIDKKLSRSVDDLADVKARLSSMESYLAAMHGDIAVQSRRSDTLAERLDRLEKRLDITDA